MNQLTQHLIETTPVRHHARRDGWKEWAKPIAAALFMAVLFFGGVMVGIHMERQAAESAASSMR